MKNEGCLYFKICFCHFILVCSHPDPAHNIANHCDHSSGHNAQQGKDNLLPRVLNHYQL